MWITQPRGGRGGGQGQWAGATRSGKPRSRKFLGNPFRSIGGRLLFARSAGEATAVRHPGQFARFLSGSTVWPRAASWPAATGSNSHCTSTTPARRRSTRTPSPERVPAQARRRRQRRRRGQPADPERQRRSGHHRNRHERHQCPADSDRHRPGHDLSRRRLGHRARHGRRALGRHRPPTPPDRVNRLRLPGGLRADHGSLHPSTAWAWKSPFAGPAATSLTLPQVRCTQASLRQAWVLSVTLRRLSGCRSQARTGASKEPSALGRAGQRTRGPVRRARPRAAAGWCSTGTWSLPRGCPRPGRPDRSSPAPAHRRR